MGFFNSICSSVSNAFSSVCASIGPIGAAALRIAGSLGPVISKLPGSLGQIGTIASILFQVFSIFKPGEKVDDIGDRAIQAGEKGIRPGNFANHEAYMDSLRKFELDPEKSKTTTQFEKIVTGLAVGSLGAEKKFNSPEGSIDALWPLVAANPEYFNPQRLQAMIEKAGDIIAVMKYFSGALGATDSSKTEKTLVSVEKSISPEKDEKTIFQELDAASKAVQSL